LVSTWAEHLRQRMTVEDARFNRAWDHADQTDRALLPSTQKACKCLFCSRRTFSNTTSLSR
jgi:hypothetical protein